jgi:hypothetical protein
MKLPGINGWTVLNWLKGQRIATHSCTCVGMNRELAKKWGLLIFN